MQKKLPSLAPDFIKVAAVVVALPRWVLALLAADGFTVPASWTWVHAVSAIFGAAMTILEGVAIAYILGAMVKAHGRQMVILGALTAGTCVTFAGVLTPSIYSRVTGEEIKVILPALGTWAWSACVALSTIATLAAVGYGQAIEEGDLSWQSVARQWYTEAQRLKAQLEVQSQVNAPVLVQEAKPIMSCFCGYTGDDLASHNGLHVYQVRQVRTPAQGLEVLRHLYPGANGSLPGLEVIAAWQAATK